MFSIRRVAIVAPLFVSALAFHPATTIAQGGEGYSLRAPSISLSMRLGMSRPDANSEIFTDPELKRLLTLDRHSFNGIQLAVDAGIMFSDRVEALVGLGIANRRAHSNYRDFVDNNDQEIEQETFFDRIPMTLGMRYYLLPLGRKVGNFAWVPTRFVPYVGGGVGVVHYRFDQRGDFIDFDVDDLEVYSGHFKSSAWGPTMYGAGGAQYALSPRTALIGELRYDRARAPMRLNYRDFEDIDLSGASFTVGFHFRY